MGLVIRVEWVVMSWGLWRVGYEMIVNGAKKMRVYVVRIARKSRREGG